jgi:hypothetical protein
MRTSPSARPNQEVLLPAAPAVLAEAAVPAPARTMTRTAAHAMRNHASDCRLNKVSASVLVLQPGPREARHGYQTA